MDFIVAAVNSIIHRPLDITAVVNLKSIFLNAMQVILMTIPQRTVLNSVTHAVFVVPVPIQKKYQLHQI